MNATGPGVNTRRGPAAWSGVAAFVLALLVWLALWPLADYGFVNWDDHQTVQNNRDFNPVTPAGVARYWKQPHMSLYVPVTYTYWGAVVGMTAEQAPGDRVPHPSPGALHTANVWLHVLTALLVFQILRLLTASNLPALLGAAFFALHPVQVEPVGWISGAKDVLAGLFGMLAIWQYLLADRAWRRVRPSTPLAATHYGLATLAFILAMLAKPAAVAVPLVAAAIAVGVPVVTAFVRVDPSRRRPKGDEPLQAEPVRDRRKALLMLGVWLLLTIPIIVIGKRVQPAPAVFVPPLWQRPLVACDAIGFYLLKVIAPVRLAVDYGRRPQAVLNHGWFYITPVLLIVFAAALWSFRKKIPWAQAAAVAFVAALLPILGLVPFEFQIYSTVSDHYLYLAMLAPALVVAFVLRWAISRKPVMPIALVAGIIVLTTLSILSNLRAQAWKDTVTLFNANIEVNPESLAANRVLAFQATQEGRREEALALYAKALKVLPDDAESHFNIGNILLTGGQPAAALDHYDVALNRYATNPKMRNNRAVALINLNRFEEGEKELTAALELNPRNAELRVNLTKIRAILNAKQQKPTTLPQTLPQTIPTTTP